HSCRFDLIAEEGNSAARSFFEHLMSDRSWHMLQIIDVPNGGNAWHIYNTAAEAGYPVGAWESQRSPYIPLSSSYEELFAGLSAKLKANVRRRRKRLEELGTVSLQRVTGGSEIIECLEEGFNIESSGWKGEQGTAIVQEANTYGFYTELANTAARQDYLSLY